MKAGGLLGGVLALAWTWTPAEGLRVDDPRTASQPGAVDRRFFIYTRLAGGAVDDPLEGFTGRQPEPVNATADGGPNSRVVFLGHKGQGVGGGFDDVGLKLKLFLSIARSLQAVPVAARPDQLLPRPAASSWDTYIETSPRLASEEEAHCAAGVQQSVMTEPRLGGLPAEVLAAMVDHSKPLCLNLDFLMFRLRPDWPGFAFDHDAHLMFEVMVKPHWASTQMWRSSATTALVQQVQTSLGWHGENSEGLSYSAAHARRGDLASTCTSPQRMLQQMLRLGAKDLWFLMSNAEDQWFKEFRDIASASGIEYRTEQDVPILQNITDGYLRYSVLECVYAAGMRRVHTVKSLVNVCHPPGKRLAEPEAQEGRLCDMRVVNSRIELVESPR